MSEVIHESKPTQKVLRPFKAFDVEVFEFHHHWFARFSESAIRQYYTQYLLLYEFADHIDWYNRHWSKANSKQSDDFASQYAVRWGADAVEVINKISPT